MRVVGCSTPCELQNNYIIPIINDADTLLLVDFPSPRDNEHGVLFSSLDTRAQSFYDALKLSGIDDQKVSIASSVRCATRAKDMRASLISGCVTELLAQLPEVKRVLCFGVLVYCAITRQPVNNIDIYRKEYVNKELGGAPRLIGCTYSLSLVSETGCSACSRSTYTVLMSKDIKRIMKQKV